MTKHPIKIVSNLFEGKIISYNKEKAYGFISTDTECGIFFHKSNLTFDDKDISIGEKATFYLMKDTHGRIYCDQVRISFMN